MSNTGDVNITRWEEKLIWKLKHQFCDVSRQTSHLTAGAFFLSHEWLQQSAEAYG